MLYPLFALCVFRIKPRLLCFLWLRNGKESGELKKRKCPIIQTPPGGLEFSTAQSHQGSGIGIMVGSAKTQVASVGLQNAPSGEGIKYGETRLLEDDVVYPAAPRILFRFAGDKGEFSD